MKRVRHEPTIIDVLPAEMLCLILSKLHPRDVCVARRTCRVLYQCGTSDSVWAIHVARVRAKLQAIPNVDLITITCVPDRQEDVYKMLMAFGYDPRCLLNWTEGSYDKPVVWLLEALMFFETNGRVTEPWVLQRPPINDFFRRDFTYRNGICLKSSYYCNGIRIGDTFYVLQDDPYDPKGNIVQCVKQYQREMDGW